MGPEADEALLAHGITAERIDAPFPLWLIETGTSPDPALPALLSRSERDRARRFAHERLRRRYQCAHGALRLIVEAASGIGARRQTYLPGLYGKPMLQQAPDLHCSLSYSGAYALVGLSMGVEIGVDLEVVRPVEDSVQLASMYYTQAEVAQLATGPADVSGHAFLTVWVRKEACSKALAKGLSIAPQSFECGVGLGLRDVLIENRIVESNVLNPKGGLLASWAWNSR